MVGASLAVAGAALDRAVAPVGGGAGAPTGLRLDSPTWRGRVTTLWVIRTLVADGVDQLFARWKNAICRGGNADSFGHTIDPRRFTSGRTGRASSPTIFRVTSRRRAADALAQASSSDQPEQARRRCGSSDAGRFIRRARPVDRARQHRTHVRGIWQRRRRVIGRHGNCRGRRSMSPAFMPVLRRAGRRRMRWRGSMTASDAARR